jgi:hypothetical protein
MKTNGQRRSWMVAAFAFVLLLAGVSSVQAQWTTSSGNTTTTDNVGIGTGSPGAKLEVSGGSGYNVILNGGNAGSLRWGYGAQGALSWDTGKALLYALSGNDLSLGANNSFDQLYLKAGGNIGIGTTNPNWRFTVNDASVNYNYDAGNIAITNSSDTTKRLLFGYDTSLGTNGSGFIQSVKSGTGTTPLLLNANGGNVGIGTTTPGARLEIGGGNGYNLILNAGNAGSLRWGNGAQGALSYDTGKAILYALAGNDLSFGANNAFDQLYLKSGGNVGIGTTSPQGKLHIKAGTNKNIWLRDGGSSQNAQIISVADDNGTINTLSIDGSNLLLNSQSSGTVAIGTSTPNTAYKLDVNGDVRVSGNISAKYQDVAEWVPSSEQLSAGTVVVLDSTKSNQVTSSSVSYDTRVAGVISEQPGLALGEKGDGKVLVATTGRVRVKVDATKGPIHIGDLLVTSDVVGVAMKSEAVNLGGVQFHRPGTLIGKALEPLEKGKGEILVLLSLQ